jgi:hypothetical protein
MPEIVSVQSAKIAAGTKLKPTEGIVKVEACIWHAPTTAAWAQNDTLPSGVRIPAGSRFLPGAFASHQAFGASVTLSVGIRDWKTKAVIDVAAIGSAVDISAAGRSAVNNGAYIAAGVDIVTSVDVELYASFLGANPTDDADIMLYVPFAPPG